MDWTSYPMPSADDCISAMSDFETDFYGNTTFDNCEPFPEDAFDNASNSQSSSECAFDDFSSMDSVYQSIVDATTMLDGEASFKPLNCDFNGNIGVQSTSDCAFDASESWPDDTSVVSTTPESVSTSESVSYSDAAPATDCPMDSTTTISAYTENANDVEKQLQWEAIYQLVNYDWVKSLTPEDASKYMMYWIAQIELATDERTGLRACYAAHQAIQIRMNYGKVPEQKRMQRMSMAVNKFKVQFSLELRFKIGTASWYC